LDGQIWALKADSLTSPLIVTVTVTEIYYERDRRTDRLDDNSLYFGHV